MTLPKVVISHTHSIAQVSKGSHKTFKALCLLYVPPGLTLTNSTFCPENAFMSFVLFSEQTAIIFLYSIKWLAL